jgi:hypothetical protein
MLEVHLYGTLRRFASKSGATDDSILMFPWHTEMTIKSLITEMGIRPEELGEIFVNYTPVTLTTSIIDGARVGLFAHSMWLLCGGQHMKGHGFITSTQPQMDYWTQNPDSHDEKPSESHEV